MVQSWSLECEMISVSATSIISFCSLLCLRDRGRDRPNPNIKCNHPYCMCTPSDGRNATVRQESSTRNGDKQDHARMHLHHRWTKQLTFSHPRNIANRWPTLHNVLHHRALHAMRFSFCYASVSVSVSVSLSVLQPDFVALPSCLSAGFTLPCRAVLCCGCTELS
jgi:hypothetical protein